MCLASIIHAYAHASVHDLWHVVILAMCAFLCISYCADASHRLWMLNHGSCIVSGETLTDKFSRYVINQETVVR